MLNDRSIKVTKVLSPMQQEQPTRTTDLKSNHEANTEIEQLQTAIRRKYVKVCIVSLEDSKLSVYKSTSFILFS